MANKAIEELKLWVRRKVLKKCGCLSHDPVLCRSWDRNTDTQDSLPCKCSCHSPIGIPLEGATA